MLYIRIKNKLKNILPKKIFNLLIKLWRNTYVIFIKKTYGNFQDYKRQKKYIKLSNKDVFTNIYNDNSWGSKESVSGLGSEYDMTNNIRKGIKDIINKYNLKTIIDAPCGDVNWIEPDKIGIDYIGLDIVKELIENNKQKFKINKKIKFEIKDITKDTLPKGDLIHCRECLQHLSEENIKNFFTNLKKSEIKFLLTTTHNSNKNINIVNGEYFEINLEKEPYNLPKPILKIEELERNKITGEEKFLALWEIKNI